MRLTVPLLTIVALATSAAAVLVSASTVNDNTPAPAPAPAPQGHACLGGNASWPFCNTNWTVDQRVDWLVSNLTILEKISLIGADGQFNPCPLVDAGVPRLGIPKYMWLDETNTGIASGCAAPNRCATTFSSPAGLAASFNRTVWQRKGEILSTEQRAMNNLRWTRFSPNSDPYFIGVDGFGPNINMVRDPRWGRNDEVPSEDPFLAGHYAANYVRGMQEGPDPRYIKMIAFLKHYTAYSVETDRAAVSANITTFDLFDTFLAQFEIAFKEGRASGAMCSYASINGVPSCANAFILNETLRSRWGMHDAVITTDCGAVQNMVDANHYAANLSDAAAKALNAGTDLNTETVFSSVHMLHAIASNETTVDAVDRALRRSLRLRFLAGLFDPVDTQPYTQLGLDHIATPDHNAQNYDAALQSLVLLRNDDGLLPLRSAEQRVAVVGPKGFSTETLLEQYYGDQVCFGGGFDCIDTVAAAMTAQGGGPLYVTAAQGVPVTGWNTSDMAYALELANQSDVIVLMLGLNRQVEGETLDRTNTDLPLIQSYFAERVLALGIPTVIVFINGGMISFDNLLNTTSLPKLAIVEAFYPGFVGASAIACALYGCANRWGKLPVTIYASSFQYEQNFFSFDMTSYPGRTYRYFQQKPLYPFGWGLSYTNFSFQCTQALAAFTLACNVSNVGSMDGDAVVLVFHRVGDEIRLRYGALHPFPIKNLVQFDRVFVPRGDTVLVPIALSEQSFETTTADGSRVVYEGEHHIMVGTHPEVFVASWRM